MHRFRKESAGFSLIELMIVVAVIGLLTTIALPSYTDYVIRGKIAEATSSLADGRVKMEQFFQDNKTYAGGPCPSDNTFKYTCSDLTNTTYTITASGMEANVIGFRYSIDQANTRITLGMKSGWSSATLPQNCWITKKGGTC